MKVKSILMFLIVITSIVISISSYAQTVRGRLDFHDQFGSYPAVDIPVTLTPPLDYRLRSLTSYTDNRGMYYFYNVPEGRYLLEIWDMGFNYEPITYRITVDRYEPYTNIRPIRLPGN